MNESEKITGKYRHYKDKPYLVYCIVEDTSGEQFVLYRKSYGYYDFWIRPISMFFENVELSSGESVQRFTNLSSPTRNYSIEKYINKLLDTLNENGYIFIKHSENESLYRIIRINMKEKKVMIEKMDNKKMSGYLSDKDLALRMGYTMVDVDGEMSFYPNEVLDETKRLKIGDNNVDQIRKLLNSCSIDLAISDNFIKSKRKTIDTHNLNNMYDTKRFWKRVKSKSGKIRILPGKSILTTTNEILKIPEDCAGKVEIKSTYARLALSISSGDFCNPGYYGKFPLEITNHSNHTIIIHKNEIMAQLLLIPLSDVTIIKYSENATFKNNEGFDDGTPFKFFEERSLKSFDDKIIQAYYLLENSLNKKEIGVLKTRFKNKFLSFCQKNKNKDKYQNQSDGSVDVKKLCLAFIKRERVYENISKADIYAMFGSLAVPIISSIIDVLKYKEFKLTYTIIIIISICVVLFIVSLVFKVSTNKSFCTFSDVDIDKLLGNL